MYLPTQLTRVSIRDHAAVLALMWTLPPDDARPARRAELDTVLTDQRARSASGVRVHPVLGEAIHGTGASPVRCSDRTRSRHACQPATPRRYAASPGRGQGRRAAAADVFRREWPQSRGVSHAPKNSRAGNPHARDRRVRHRQGADRSTPARAEQPRPRTVRGGGLPQLGAAASTPASGIRKRNLYGRSRAGGPWSSSTAGRCFLPMSTIYLQAHRGSCCDSSRLNRCSGSEGVGQHPWMCGWSPEHAGTCPRR